MNKRIGLIGEKLAVRYIREKAYNVLACNYTTRLGEIDIIAKQGNTIVFIEVKTRTTNTFGTPSEAVDYRKQEKIQKISQQYILYKNLHKSCFNYRFDVIAVSLIGKRYKIDHIEDAF